MKQTTIEKIAKELGKEVEYRKYLYWENVPHIKNTAICVDIITENGGQTIIRDAECFPRFITKKYIKEAIEAGAESLALKKPKKSFGAKEWFKFDEINMYK